MNRKTGGSIKQSQCFLPKMRVQKLHQIKAKLADSHILSFKFKKIMSHGGDLETLSHLKSSMPSGSQLTIPLTKMHSIRKFNFKDISCHPTTERMRNQPPHTSITLALPTPNCIALTKTESKPTTNTDTHTKNTIINICKPKVCE